MEIKAIHTEKPKKGKNYMLYEETYNAKEDKTLLTYEQIKTYCKELEKELEKKYGNRSEMMVRGLNILGNTTLKGYKSGFYDDDKDYLDGEVEDTSKFKYLYNFTVTIKVFNEEE